VFRAEGKYPIAPVADFWPFAKYGRTHKMSDLLTVGEKWKDVRVKLQPEILSPQAAAQYLPSLTLVGRQASDAFALMGSNPYDLTSRVSFDMFGITMLGKSPGVLFPSTAAKEDVEFIHNSIACMRTAGLMTYSPYESFMQKYVDTKLYKEFEKATDNVNRRSEQLVHEAMMSTNDDSLDGGSYLQRLMRTGSMTKQQAGFEVTGLLLAAVDTTANYMNWIIYNLAANPSKQTLLAEELKNVLKGGDFNKEVELPYLQACYRETHRHSPLLTNVFRKLEEDIVLEGYLIPAGTQLSMNTDAVQRDPQYVHDADIFLPERWLASAVEARKGTPSEVIDHRLLAGPFSFGPRMCLGARLAELEIKVFIARIVQDWEFCIDPESSKVEVKEMLFMSPFPEFRLVFKRR
jgi:cholestanetriol 26-monooxygenase